MWARHRKAGEVDGEGRKVAATSSGIAGANSGMSVDAIGRTKLSDGFYASIVSVRGAEMVNGK